VIVALSLSILLGGTAAAQAPPAPGSAAENSIVEQEPITPVPPPPPADPRKLAIGERLFSDARLSGAGNLSCNSCHDLHSNGARPDD
jgi:cytochrome c peroxidase